MMPRKKRRTILIGTIILILLIILAGFALLYINTDMFKSDKTLFAKYLGQNVQNIDENYQKMWTTNEYDQLLEQNKYTTTTQAKVNYRENVGTSSESAKNSINQLKVEIKGQVDKNNQYSYQDINLLKNDEKVTEVEYVKNKDVYGVRFSDLFNQYLLVNYDDTAILTEEMKNALEETENIKEIKELFSLSEEEKQKLQTKYINILNSNVNSESFSKQKNQTIQLDGKSTNVNAYILTLTKEQINNLYIKILEEVKNDEIILGKIDSFQAWLEKYPTIETGDLVEQFTEKVEELISKITRNNIGQEEAKITVYENYHHTVRTLIELPEYEIMIDQVIGEDENYGKVSFKDIENEKEKALGYRKTNQKLSLNLENTDDEDVMKYSLDIMKKVNGKKCTKNIVAKYEDESNRVEAIIDQEINIIDELEDEIVFEEGDYINLSELEEEQQTSILEQVNSKLSEKLTKISTDINAEELVEVLKVVGFVREDLNFEATGVTDTERKRFNSKFELLQGEKLESVDVLKIIDAIQENFVNIEVVSNTELKLKLDRFSKNEEMTNILTNFMEENKNKKYNAKVEYDAETGLVSDIVLTMLEK